MTTQELIVKYIKDNSGCIKAMYYEEDQADVDESCLLNPEDWEFMNHMCDPVTEAESEADDDSDQHWVLNTKVSWNCDGIVFLVDKLGTVTGYSYRLDDGRWFDIQED